MSFRILPKIHSSKDDFDRHFAIVVSGAERTRGILYFFAIVLVVSVVFFFEDKFNTSGRRLEVMNGALACVEHSLEPSQTVPLKGSFYKRNSNCQFYYDYVRNYYHINLPAPVPSDFSTTPSLTKDAFFEKYKAVLKDDTDFLSTTIPLLNIKIDRNDGLILQNTMAVLILAILGFSLHAENKSLTTIAGLAGRQYRRIKAILDTHVFNRATASPSILLGAIIFGPVLLQLPRIREDWNAENKQIVLDLYGDTLYLYVETISLVATLLCAMLCFRQVVLLNSKLRALEETAMISTAMQRREEMNRKLDLLAVLVMAGMLVLIAVPVLARVNP